MRKFLCLEEKTFLFLIFFLNSRTRDRVFSAKTDKNSLESCIFTRLFKKFTIPFCVSDCRLILQKRNKKKVIYFNIRIGDRKRQFIWYGKVREKLCTCNWMFWCKILSIISLLIAQYFQLTIFSPLPKPWNWEAIWSNHTEPANLFKNCLKILSV